MESLAKGGRSRILVGGDEIEGSGVVCDAGEDDETISDLKYSSLKLND